MEYGYCDFCRLYKLLYKYFHFGNGVTYMVCGSCESAADRNEGGH